MNLYAVMCNEEGVSDQLVIATKKPELFNKLNSMYEITNDQLQELLVTKTVNISYTQGGAQPQITKYVSLCLDSTQL